MALIRREDVWALVGDHTVTVRPGSKLEWVIHRYVNAIDGAPEVDAVPVVHARWQRVSPFVDSEECSHCRYNIPSDEFETPYCPWCGAKMDGERRDKGGTDLS